MEKAYNLLGALCPHFTLRTAEAQRDKVACLGAQPVKGWSWDLNQAALRTLVLHHNASC